MDTLLEVRDLSVDFLTPRGRVHALRNVDLAVPRGEIVGLVGESGCGKTTLISAVMRLLADNAEIRGGEIVFDGRDILQLGESELRRLRGDRIAMVFQDPMTALNPVLLDRDPGDRHPVPRPGRAGPRSAAARSTCCGASASRTPSSGSIATRTSSRAACASASASRWR